MMSYLLPGEGSHSSMIFKKRIVMKYIWDPVQVYISCGIEMYIKSFKSSKDCYLSLFNSVSGKLISLRNQKRFTSINNL